MDEHIRTDPPLVGPEQRERIVSSVGYARAYLARQLEAHGASSDVIGLCWALLSGLQGGHREYIADLQREFGAKHHKCGFIWHTGYVAYRCRTCALSPCMSLCTDCFQASDHSTHDFIMFKSCAGGACDCGDADVCKASGFCPNHSTPETESKVPENRVHYARMVFRTLLLWLVRGTIKSAPIVPNFSRTGANHAQPTNQINESNRMNHRLYDHEDGEEGVGIGEVEEGGGGVNEGGGHMEVEGRRGGVQEGDHMDLDVGAENEQQGGDLQNFEGNPPPPNERRGGLRRRSAIRRPSNATKRRDLILELAKPVIEFFQAICDSGDILRSVLCSESLKIGTAMEDGEDLIPIFGVGVWGAIGLGTGPNLASANGGIFPNLASGGSGVSPNMTSGGVLPGGEGSLMDELMRWGCDVGFPEQLCALLLKMLPDVPFKRQFVRLFSRHYKRLIETMIKSTDSVSVSTRLIHISVQLYSGYQLALPSVQHDRLLDVMFESLKWVCDQISHDVPDMQLRVVDCKDPIIRHHLFGPVTSDIVNVLTHKCVAQYMMQQRHLMSGWLDLIVPLQLMHSTHKQYGHHIEYESEEWVMAFGLEMEMSASALMFILPCCDPGDEESRAIPGCLEFVDLCVSQLRNIFQRANLVTLSQSFTGPLELLSDCTLVAQKGKEFQEGSGLARGDPDTIRQISFHIPLHRWLGMIVSMLVYASYHPAAHKPPPPRENDGFTRFGKRSDDNLEVKELRDSTSRPPITTKTVMVGLRTMPRRDMGASPQVKRSASASIVGAMEGEEKIARYDPDLMGDEKSDRNRLDGRRKFKEIDGNDEETDTKDNQIRKFALGDVLKPGVVDETFFKMLLEHPLAIQVATSQIRAGLWRKNGDAPYRQAWFYLSPNFSDYGFDVDIFTMQLCAVHLPPDYLIGILIARFGLGPWLQATQKQEIAANGEEGANVVDTLVEDMLLLVLTLLSQRIYIGQSVHEVIRSEIITRLAIGTYTHSQLSDSISSRYVQHDDFERVLAQVADYHEPVNLGSELRQGMYTLKLPLWETEFDPLLVLNRSFLRRDYNSALARYKSACSSSVPQRPSSDTKPSPAVVLPPFRIPQKPLPPYQPLELLLECRSLHYVMHTVLVRAVSALSIGSPCMDNLLFVALHLLRCALELSPLPQNSTNDTPEHQSAASSNFTGPGLFPSSNIYTNARFLLAGHEFCTSSGIQKNAGNDTKYGCECILHMVLQLRDHPDHTPYRDYLHNLIGLLAKDLQNSVLVEKYETERKTELERVRTEASADQRRQKARARQSAILAEFAARQRLFMERNATIPLASADDGTASTHPAELPPTTPTETPDVSKPRECVICSSTGPSTTFRPLGLVALLQTAQATPTRVIRPVSVRANVTEPPTPIHIQTCGHSMHLDCHAAYVQSMTTSQQVELDPYRGEYWCPLCRQLANALLPVLPDALLPTPTTNLQSPQVTYDTLLHTAPIGGGRGMQPHVSLPIDRFVASVASCASHDCHRPLPHLPLQRHEFVNTTQELIACNIATLMEEYDWRTGLYGTNDGVRPESNRLTTTQATSLALQSLQWVCRIAYDRNVIAETAALWRQLIGDDPAIQSEAGVGEPHHPDHPHGFTQAYRWANGQSHTVNLHLESVQHTWGAPQHPPYREALICKDPRALLLEFVWWTQLPLEIYQNVVRMVMWLVLVRAGMTFLQSRFETSSTDKSFILDLFFEKISPYLIRGEGGHHANATVHTDPPLSRNEIIVGLCLPFLRHAAMLQHLLYQCPLPKRDDINQSPADIEHSTPHSTHSANSTEAKRPIMAEFWCMARGLGLCGDVGAGDDLLPIFGVFDEDVSEMVKRWCNGLPYHASEVSPQELLRSSLNKQPTLIPLPALFDDLFVSFRTKVCSHCQTVPEYPALCLMCGELQCFGGRCCSTRDPYIPPAGGGNDETTGKIGECVRHARKCGTGTGIFLLLQATTVYVIRGKRGFVWGSPYLDAFGEEDVDLKRGKPLFFNTDRYLKLQALWRRQEFEYSFSQRWTWHHSAY